MEDFYTGGDDIMFTIGPIFIFVVFVIIIGLFIFAIISSIVKWNKNNQQPRLSTPAKVVTKRTSVHGGGESSSYSNYYITFEFPSGDRTEFQLKGEEYGMLVEGDSGELQFQGTRYLGFTRNKHIEENR